MATAPDGEDNVRHEYGDDELLYTLIGDDGRCLPSG